MYYRTYKDSEKKNQASLEEERFCKPVKYNPNGTLRTAGTKSSSYNLLDENGFVKVGSHVKGGDVIIGKVVPLKNTSESGPKFKDASTTIPENSGGTVDWVYVSRDSDGYQFGKVRVRSKRVPNIGDKFCLTPDHDVLTNKGWINITELTLKHKVATLVNNELRYENPSETHEFDFNKNDGKMYQVDSEQVKLCVTPNHRMYIKKRGKEKYTIEYAKDIYGKRVKYLKNAKWVTKSSDIFTLNGYNNVEEKKINMNDMLTILGIWYSEGWCYFENKNTEHCVIGISVNKKRVRDALFPIFEKNKIHYNYQNKSEKVTVRDQHLARYLYPLSVGAINKTLPDWVWELSEEHSKILLNSMVLGDGYIQKNNVVKYFTSSEKLADDFQRLALHCGWSANKYMRQPKGSKVFFHKGTGKEREVITNVDAYSIHVNKSKNSPQVNHGHTNEKHDKWIDYEGKVYCCTVPSGVFYVRRNGIPVWTGNSSRFGQLADVTSQEVSKSEQNRQQPQTAGTSRSICYQPLIEILKGLMLTTLSMVKIHIIEIIRI
jgi:hypothetical protein